MQLCIKRTLIHILLRGLIPENLRDLTGVKVREALQQRMKQQHEREWGNTHASLSAAAAAAATAAGVVWGWAAISVLLIQPAVIDKSLLCCTSFLLTEGQSCWDLSVRSQLLSAWYDGESRPTTGDQLAALAQKTCGECVCRLGFTSSWPRFYRK